MLAWRQRCPSLPLDLFKTEEIPGEDRRALQEVETVATEAAALCDQHAVAAALGHLDLSLEVVGRIKHRGGVAIRSAGERRRPGERRAAGRDTGAGRNQPRGDCR